MKWLFKLFRPQQDENEIRVKAKFSFLLDDYGFSFAKEDLGNAVNRDGNFVFYGPLNAYFIYNENVCINILYLVQRQDYEIYITDLHKNNQVYIRNGIRVSDELAYDLDRFALEVKKSVKNSSEICGHKM